CEQLGQELTGLRQTQEDLNAQLAKAHQAGADTARRVKELEDQLQLIEGTPNGHAAELEQQVSQGVAALARVTAHLAKAGGEGQRMEARAAALNQRLQELHADLKRLLESQRADQETIVNLENQLRQRDEAFARQAAELEEQKSQWQMAEEQLH